MPIAIFDISLATQEKTKKNNKHGDYCRNFAWLKIVIKSTVDNGFCDREYRQLTFCKRQNS